MNNNVLLSRDNFRESVFKRDNHKCIICKDAAKNAHHIIERRLFNNGGYYLDNGASLCEKHHIEAEQTTLSCEQIRFAAGITNIIIPDHLYEKYNYDKWGNIILANEQRIKGELFYDESVQKILKQGGVLDLFQKYVKYQRTYHLPYSTLSKDDRILEDDSNFIGKEVVVTLKMDGENTTLYNDYIHARSLNFKSHKTRHWVKGLWSKVAYLIDDNMRICGENLYAVHTIKYENLNSYFIEYANQNHETYSITFADICNWQKELFEYKVLLWSDLTKLDDEEDFEVEVCSFPNLYINLGLRSTTVKVGNFTPPHPMFLEDLKVMCFPLKIDSEFLTLPSVYDNGLINGSKIDDEYFKYWITEWYKIFQTVHYFEDLNGRLGGIVINILSYILTNKYLINEQYSKKNSRWI